MFCIKLSRQLGMTLKQFLNQIDSDELALQMAYDRLEPPDDPYFRTGLECSTLIKVMTGKYIDPEKFCPTKKVKPIKNDKALIAAMNALKSKPKPKETQ